MSLSRWGQSCRTPSRSRTDRSVPRKWCLGERFQTVRGQMSTRCSSRMLPSCVAVTRSSTTMFFATLDSWPTTTVGVLCSKEVIQSECVAVNHHQIVQSADLSRVVGNWRMSGFRETGDKGIAEADKKICGPTDALPARTYVSMQPMRGHISCHHHCACPTNRRRPIRTRAVRLRL